MINFCKSFEQLYGKKHFTPNMHLHMHLKECITGFGPSHSFWCFPFERCNGLLGSYSTNKKAIEVQVMRKCCSAQWIHSLMPSVDNKLHEALPLGKQGASKSLAALCTDDSSVISLLAFAHSPLESIKSFENCGIITLLPPLYEKVFDSDELQQLTTIYMQLYPGKSIGHMSQFYRSCKRVTLGGELMGSLAKALSQQHEYHDIPEALLHQSSPFQYKAPFHPLSLQGQREWPGLFHGIQLMNAEVQRRC